MTAGPKIHNDDRDIVVTQYSGVSFRFWLPLEALANGDGQIPRYNERVHFVKGK